MICKPKPPLPPFLKEKSLIGDTSDQFFISIKRVCYMIDNYHGKINMNITLNDLLQIILNSMLVISN